MNEAIAFTLCHKVTDSEGDQSEWSRVNCCNCGTPLRLTRKTKDAARIVREAGTKLRLIPICLECAVKGPAEAARLFEQQEKNKQQGEEQ
jgi:RNase P subunit RPR2